MPLPINAEKLLRKAMEAHRDIYNALATVKQSVTSESSCEDLAEYALALRESEKHLDDLRKEVKGYGNNVERLACLRYMEDASRVMKGEPIRTDMVTATPDMKVNASIPTFEKQPFQYAELMTYLGIDSCLWDKGKVLTELGEEHTEVVRVHWPGFQSLITRLKAGGHQLPDGIDPNATFTEFALRMRKKGASLLSKTMEVDDNAEQPITNVENVSFVSDSEIPF